MSVYNWPLFYPLIHQHHQVPLPPGHRGTTDELLTVSRHRTRSHGEVLAGVADAFLREVKGWRFVQQYFFLFWNLPVLLQVFHQLVARVFYCFAGVTNEANCSAVLLRSMIIKGTAKSKVMLQLMHSMCKSYSKTVVYLYTRQPYYVENQIKNNSRAPPCWALLWRSPTSSSGGHSTEVEMRCLWGHSGTVWYTLAAPPRVSVICRDGCLRITDVCVCVCVHACGVCACVQCVCVWVQCVYVRACVWCVYACGVCLRCVCVRACSVCVCTCMRVCVCMRAVCVCMCVFL